MRWLLLGGVVATAAACGPSTPSSSRVVSAGALELACASHGLRAYDASRSLLPGISMPCSVKVADNQARPIAGVRLTVLSEAGRMTVDGVTNDDGMVALTHQVSAPTPQNVPAGRFTLTPLVDASHTGTSLAPAWMQPQTWVRGVEPSRPDPLRLGNNGERLLNNPRDNLVTWIVVTEGEEAFVDLDGNGRRDQGEGFVDLTEPFVDRDDDGTWEQGELFIDTNGNGLWDGANGTWDAKTQIWAAERVLWTGVPDRFDVEAAIPGVVGNRPSVNINRPMEMEFVCLETTCTRATATESTTAVFFADPWFNAMSFSEGDRCTLANSDLPVRVASDSFKTRSSQSEWPLGETLNFIVSDARVTPTPARTPPEPFTVEVNCRFSSAGGAAPVDFTLLVATGTIQ
ncbi:MAG: hypothetical protein QM817_39420 [Archangium sp.]